jgi:hypothetical protein
MVHKVIRYNTMNLKLSYQQQACALIKIIFWTWVLSNLGMKMYICIGVGIKTENKRRTRINQNLMHRN